MYAQPIGKDLWRVVVASRKTREKLGKIPGVRIYDERVIFPAAERAAVERILAQSKRTRKHLEEEE
jgi:hypothetical protein